MRAAGLQRRVAACWGLQPAPSAFLGLSRSVTAPWRRFTGQACNSAAISAVHSDNPVTFTGLDSQHVSVIWKRTDTIVILKTQFSPELKPPERTRRTLTRRKGPEVSAKSKLRHVLGFHIAVGG